MNKKNKNVNKTEYASVQQYRWRVIVVFVAILVFAMMVLSIIIAQKSSDTMQSKITSLISANNYQQVMNVDNYFGKIKDTTSLFFSDEIYYMYDSTSTDMDEFDKIQQENAILNRIQDLGVLENYSDFGVVYADDHTVGWISDSTFKAFEDGEMYEVFASKITDEKSESGWFSGTNGNFDSLYYVKRLNENAILFSSFYAREIESVFFVPEDMHDMIIRLIDENSVVLYSTDKNEIGKVLDTDEDISVKNKGNLLVLSGDTLITSSKCNSNDWFVVCSFPKDVIMRESNNLKMFTYIISSVMLAFVLIFGLFILRRISEPMGEMVSALEQKAVNDQLTGLLNKISFTNAVINLIDTNKNKVAAFIMLDMDNFKTVNDTLGHDMGDKVLIRIAEVFKKHFSDEYVIGRLGGDEFAVYVCYGDKTKEQLTELLKADMEKLHKEFLVEFKEENVSCKLSLSSGLFITENSEVDFDKMYKSADRALYKSKKDGKNRSSIY